MTEGPHLTPEQRKDLDRAQRFIASKKKTPRAPFFNGWMIFTCTILALISCTTGVAAVMDRDAVTEPAQMIGCRHARGAGADDGHSRGQGLGANQPITLDAAEQASRAQAGEHGAAIGPGAA